MITIRLWVYVSTVFGLVAAWACWGWLFWINAKLRNRLAWAADELIEARSQILAMGGDLPPWTAQARKQLAAKRGAAKTP